MKLRGVFTLALALVLATAPVLAQVNPGTSPLSIAKGGTSGATASAARTALGLAIGTNVEAWDTDLDCLAALASNGVLQRTGSGACAALTNAQLTALVNNATASLSGTVPAWPNNTTTFFRGDGTYAAVAFASLTGLNSVAQLATGGASHATIIDVAGTPTWKVVPDCQDIAGNHINYTQSSDVWSCGTTSSGGGGTATLVAPQGRLTLTSNVPVMTTSQASQTTLYYDSYAGNGVPYYTGGADVIDTIASNQVSTAMQSSSTGVLNATGVFDVWWEGNTHHNICIATNGSGGGWASDTAGSNTARGTGYSQIDNTTRPYITNKNAVAHCYNGSTDYGSITVNKLTYLGTIATTAAGQVDYIFGALAAGGTAGVFNVFNGYNRVNVATIVRDSTASWNYAVATTWRAANGSATARVTMVRGLDEEAVQAMYSSIGSPGSATIATAGVGVDSTAAFSGTTAPSFTTAVVGAAIYSGTVGVGEHFVSAIEWNSTTTASSWFGSAASSQAQTGLHVTFRQ